MYKTHNNIEYNILVAQAVNITLERRNKLTLAGVQPEGMPLEDVRVDVEFILQAREDPEIIKMYTEYKGRIKPIDYNE